MKDFKLFSYIRKCWMLIVLSSLVMGMLFYSYFSGKQTYTASAIIQYKNAEAVNGLAPDGTKRLPGGQDPYRHGLLGGGQHRDRLRQDRF